MEAESKEEAPVEEENKDEKAEKVEGSEEQFQGKTVPKSEEQRDQLAQKLRTSAIFDCLGPEELGAVVDAMEECRVAKDEVVVKQGDEANAVYVLESGALNFTQLIVSKGER